MDIDQIRRRNIRLLEAEIGGPTLMASRLGMSGSQYTNLRDGARDSRTGKPRGMRKETAWKFEDAFHKGRGWLDREHEDAQPTPPAPDYPHQGKVALLVHTPDPLLSELLALAGRMSPIGLARLVGVASQLAEQYPKAQANHAS